MSQRSSSSSSEGVMMILSPAKTLDLSAWNKDTTTVTNPSCDETKTLELVNAMKQRSPSELMKLLGISSKLANVAHTFWSDFDTSSNNTNNDQLKPAIYAFSGPAYQGLNVKDLDPHQHSDSIAYLQRNLVIIDPLYGALRPMDLIQPYRLEMATKNVTKKISNLAKYWTDSVTAFLSNTLLSRTNRILLNLASDEYSSAVDPSQLPSDTHYIKIIFRQEGKVISVHAKRARGLMARFVCEHQIDTLDGIQKFDMEGYHLVPSESSDHELVFDRKKQPPAQKSNINSISSGAATKKRKPTTSPTSTTQSTKKTTSRKKNK